MKKKVLVVDKIHDSLITILNQHDFIVDYFPLIKKSEAQSIINNYEVVIIRSKFKIDESIVLKDTKLELVCRVGSGLENIDTSFLKSLNIVSINTPEGNRDSVAEHTMGMLLSLMNNICKANAELKKGTWDRLGNWGTELKGKTIGIIGYGNMGEAFAKRLIGFDVKTIAYDKYKFNYTDNYVEEKSFEEVLEFSDIISLHIPLTEETHYLIDDTFIKAAKKPFVLINTSRGKIVNTANLVIGLKTGKVLGALLDVLEFEDLDFENVSSMNKNPELQFLQESENVIMTPHIAGWSNQSYEKLSITAANKILMFYKITKE